MNKPAVTTCERLGHVEIKEGKVGPGENWGNLTESFAYDGQYDGATVGILGRYAGIGITSTKMHRDLAEFNEAVARFAESAEPPISEDDIASFEAGAFEIYRSRIYS